MLTGFGGLLALLSQVGSNSMCRSKDVGAYESMILMEYEDQEYWLWSQSGLFSPFSLHAELCKPFNWVYWLSFLNLKAER